MMHREFSQENSPRCPSLRKPEPKAESGEGVFELNGGAMNEKEWKIQHLKKIVEKFANTPDDKEKFPGKPDESWSDNVEYAKDPELLAQAKQAMRDWYRLDPQGAVSFVAKVFVPIGWIVGPKRVEFHRHQIILAECICQVIAEVDPQKAYRTFKKMTQNITANNFSYPRQSSWLARVVTPENLDQFYVALQRHELKLPDDDRRYADLSVLKLKRGLQNQNPDEVFQMMEERDYHLTTLPHGEDRRIIERSVVQLFLQMREKGERALPEDVVRAYRLISLDAGRGGGESLSTISSLTSEQKRELENWIRQQTQFFSSNQWLDMLGHLGRTDAYHQSNLYTRDRMFEDWAFREAPKNLDQVLEAVK
ncbi:hypothetical protein EXS71_01040 [Candidatus Uhrbacteria bacterium]|nr:hypothetical protein [Candidatus Uhrbacteria bacterium]